MEKIDNNFENKFWLQSFGDNARFILAAISLKETEEVEKYSIL